MKRVILATLLLMTVCATVAEARYTRGYVKQNGTYVQGYYGN